MAGTVASAGIAVIGAAVIVAAAGVGAASVVAQRVAGAADSAALAAADAASGAVPGVPCDRAAEVASALGAGMRSCELVELIATVSVSVPFGAFEVTATARAGPPP
ncbi:MAG: helicase [Actinobacteria bacterium]|jgi:secretion/DNA translocation related TadE-like protein|uniref:Rv3654c family TadE-like protein n=1 Tax=Microbacterium TaxID=33882 RepID=UPI000EF0D5ED|nr:Rv3654c family TadE-like protein [Microbacterium sp. UBA837]MEC8762161.1 Rv3654c family TadE-like protein [Actinomycetota bacterium]HAM12182.1 helicase [Microbacterium sp.]RUA26843.1 MAG: helicase [Actinomycetota bacterium]HCM50215.1 helicase [Microbacterium sp.]HCU77977.1 helicase [Microbacterium sp.]|tara:strand:- start:6532 stop:6849 length:318 start_codon:yes stop_codon:yes gene_type:complete